MARVLVARQPWGTLWEKAADRKLSVPASGTGASINTTVYSAATGSGTVSSFVTNTDGELPGWVEEGTHTLTVNSVATQVEAVSYGGTKAAVDAKAAKSHLPVNALDPQFAPNSTYTQSCPADGTSHPLSEVFATLGAAQAVYPHVTALTQERDWAALQAAINSASGRKSRVVVDGGSFVTTTGLNFDSTHGNGIVSVAGASNQAKTLITYTPGGTGAIVSAKGTQGFGMYGIRVVASSNAFAGYFVDLNLGSGAAATTFARIDQCWFNGAGASISPGAAAGVRMTSAISCEVIACEFQYMQFGIIGWDGSAGIAPTNVNVVRGCGFYFATVMNIANMQQGAVVEGNAFEPLLNGRTGIIGQTGVLSTTANGAQALPAATITVVSTDGFPTAGQFNSPQGVITYTGKTATTFTGATGGTGTLANGATVWPGPFANAVTAPLTMDAQSIVCNWWGDQTAAGGDAIAGLLEGVEIVGNYFGDATANLPTNFIRLLNFSMGVEISANKFNGSATACNAINIGSSVQGVVIDSNNFNGSGLVPYTGGSNIQGFSFRGNGGTATGSKRTARSGVSTATLVAGTVTVNNSLVTADSVIQLTCQVPGGTPGFLRVSARTAGTSFTILSSSNTDTSIVGYDILEPAPA